MKVRIALVQCSLTKDAKSNLAKSVKLVEQAAKAGAKIVCLQELFSSPYFPQTARHEDFSYAENIPGPTSRAMERLARRQKIYSVTTENCTSPRMRIAFPKNIFLPTGTWGIWLSRLRMERSAC